MEKSCGAVMYRVEDNQRLYLLLHYEENHWDLPKGHVESGESEQETARREINEETGLAEFDFDPDFRQTIRYSYKKGGKEVEKEVVFFIAKTAKKQAKLSHEHKGFVWLPYQSALKKITYENTKEVVRKAEKHLASLK